MTRLPRRQSDLVNKGLTLRASDIERLRPEIGTAAEASAMAMVLAYNVRLLRDAGITELHHQLCHQCGLSSFAGQDNHTHICGYCGHGPFGPGWCTDGACLVGGPAARRFPEADRPGEGTWWAVELIKVTERLYLFCGSCVWQIPSFLNHYQSQLLNPDPQKWSGEVCDGCSKALVIVALGAPDDEVTAGASLR